MSDEHMQLLANSFVLFLTASAKSMPSRGSNSIVTPPLVITFITLLRTANYAFIRIEAPTDQRGESKDSSEIDLLEEQISKRIPKLKRRRKEKSISTEDVSHSPVNSNDTPKQIVPQCDSDTPEQIENISDNTSNSNIQESETRCSTSSIYAESISPEDKEIVEFLELQNKERIKRSNLSCDIKTVTNGNDQNSVPSCNTTGNYQNLELLYDTKTVNIGNDAELYSDSSDEIPGLDRNQVTEQTLKRDLIKSTAMAESNEHYPKKVIEDSTQSLTYWFEKAIKSGLKEILCWYHYSFEIENKVKNITADGKIKDKTARSMIYKEMLQYLPNVTCGFEPIELKKSQAIWRKGCWNQ
ncbi:9663_t:CDS:2 [Diversispora eburnea]|uniref:9663_t:CDS:1 n=1 Tax=Diversispora eburnea TaxID=1213867 RepID=A0A9N9GBF4_9GLOM|nr:9663_t:CDS:2 [Diversispora eburnea]